MDIYLQLDNILDELEDKGDILTLDDLTNLYDKISAIVKIEKVVKKQILTRLQAGEKATNYKLVRTKGQTEIVDPNELLTRLEKRTKRVGSDIDFYDVIQPKSISALKEYFVAEILDDILDGCVEKGEGKSFDFAPHDDSRPEVTNSKK